MLVKLNGFQQKVSVVEILLSPLKKGKPVILRVSDPRLPKKKRAPAPLLFITPFTVYGRLSSRFVVALESHGCEVCDAKTGILPITFYRMGLSMGLSVVLANELNRVFNTGATNHGYNNT